MSQINFQIPTGKTSSPRLSDYPDRQSLAFNITKTAEGVSKELISHAQAVVQQQEIPTIANPTPGRSLFTITPSNISEEFLALKIKGGGGLQINDQSNFQLQPPRPDQPYGKLIQYHVGLTEDLSVVVTPGKQRFRFCLDASRAETEYECHDRLSKCGLSFKPIFCGNYEGLKTSDNQSIGAVALEYKPEFKLLTEYHLFRLIELRSGKQIFKSDSDTYFENWKDKFLDRLTALLDDYGVTAELKQRAYLEANVGRHTGHLGNFYSNGNRIMLTDTDSCVLLETLQDNKRGPLMLRDVAAELHCLSYYVGFVAYSKHFKQLLTSGSVNIFESYLTNFFSGLTSKEKIGTASNNLQARYLNFLETNQETLNPIASALGLSNLCNIGNTSALRKKWIDAHNPFMIDCLCVAYSLVSNSNTLSGFGFTLPKLYLKDLKNRLSPGLNEYFYKVANQGVRQAGTEGLSS